jgi:hypothetical protein
LAEKEIDSVGVFLSCLKK